MGRERPTAEQMADEYIARAGQVSTEAATAFEHGVERERALKDAESEAHLNALRWILSIVEGEEIGNELDRIALIVKGALKGDDMGPVKDEESETLREALRRIKHYAGSCTVPSGPTGMESGFGEDPVSGQPREGCGTGAMASGPSSVAESPSPGGGGAGLGDPDCETCEGAGAVPGPPISTPDGPMETRQVDCPDCQGGGDGLPKRLRDVRMTTDLVDSGCPGEPDFDTQHRECEPGEECLWLAIYDENGNEVATEAEDTPFWRALIARYNAHESPGGGEGLEDAAAVAERIHERIYDEPGWRGREEKELRIIYEAIQEDRRRRPVRLPERLRRLEVACASLCADLDEFEGWYDDHKVMVPLKLMRAVAKELGEEA